MVKFWKKKNPGKGLTGAIFLIGKIKKYGSSIITFGK